MILRKLKSIVFIITLTLLSFTLASPTMAIDKSKFFAATSMIFGVGLKFASVYMENKANEAYDQYLHTAVQTDMRKYTDDYDSKHLQSMITSRLGIGFVGLAVFMSLYEQFHSISVEEEGENSLLPQNNGLNSPIGMLSLPIDASVRYRGLEDARGTSRESGQTSRRLRWHLSTSAHSVSGIKVVYLWR
jgi:hypothetical protein